MLYQDSIGRRGALLAGAPGCAITMLAFATTLTVVPVPTGAVSDACVALGKWQIDGHEEGKKLTFSHSVVRLLHLHLVRNHLHGGDRDPLDPCPTSNIRHRCSMRPGRRSDHYPRNTIP